MHLQVDSTAMLGLLMGKTKSMHIQNPLCKRIRQMMAINWAIRVTHTYRKGNLVADSLVSKSLGAEYGFHWPEFPPWGCTSPLLQDVSGVTTSRVCVS